MKFVNIFSPSDSLVIHICWHASKLLSSDMTTSKLQFLCYQINREFNSKLFTNHDVLIAMDGMWQQVANIQDLCINGFISGLYRFSYCVHVRAITANLTCYWLPFIAILQSRVSLACPASLYPICVRSEAFLASLGPSDMWQADRSV